MRKNRPTGDDFMEYYDDTFVREFMARSVHEDYESVDTGLIDEEGNKIRARRKPNPIGFIWRKP